MVDVLLAAGDALKAQLAVHQGAASTAPDTGDLLANIRAMAEGQANAPAAAKPAAPAIESPTLKSMPVPKAQTRCIELVVGPLEHPETADNLFELFKEIEGLGTIEPLDAGRAADGIRRFRVITTTSDNELLDLFTSSFAPPTPATASSPMARVLRPRRIRSTPATASSSRCPRPPSPRLSPRRRPGRQRPRQPSPRLRALPPSPPRPRPARLSTRPCASPWRRSTS
jgi:hypothetical protein